MAEFGGGGPIPILGGGGNNHKGPKRTGVQGLVAFINHLDEEGMYEPELMEEVMVPNPQNPAQLVPGTRMVIGRKNIVSAEDLVEMVWKRIRTEINKYKNMAEEEFYKAAWQDGWDARQAVIDAGQGVEKEVPE